jgi:hypothetical protein
MKQIGLIFKGIGIVLVLLAACWAVFTYLGQYALCADVSQSNQKINEKMDKAIEMMEKKTDKMINYFDYKFLAAELKAIEESIYQKEQEIAKSPNDRVKQAELEKLKRQREQVIRDMQGIKK